MESLTTELQELGPLIPHLTQPGLAAREQALAIGLVRSCLFSGQGLQGLSALSAAAQARPTAF